MPNAAGFITTTELRRMVKMRAEDGMTFSAIAEAIGCSHATAHFHLCHLKRQTPTQQRRITRAAWRGRKYDRFVALASAYVPTFGGGR